MHPSPRCLSHLKHGEYWTREQTLIRLVIYTLYHITQEHNFDLANCFQFGAQFSQAGEALLRHFGHPARAAKQQEHPCSHFPQWKKTEEKGEKHTKNHSHTLLGVPFIQRRRQEAQKDHNTAHPRRPEKREQERACSSLERQQVPFLLCNFHNVPLMGLGVAA